MRRHHVSSHFSFVVGYFPTFFTKLAKFGCQMLVWLGKFRLSHVFCWTDLQCQREFSCLYSDIKTHLFLHCFDLSTFHNLLCRRYILTRNGKVLFQEQYRDLSPGRHARCPTFHTHLGVCTDITSDEKYRISHQISHFCPNPLLRNWSSVPGAELLMKDKRSCFLLQNLHPWRYKAKILIVRRHPSCHLWMPTKVQFVW